MRRAAVVSCAVAITWCAAGAARSGATASPLGVTVPTKINDERGGQPRTYTPAAVLVDPHHPLRVYVATVELRSRRCGFARSGDGGRTWTRGASPSPASHPLCSHSAPLMPMGALAMGDGGRIYYLHAGWSHHDEGPAPTSSIFLARSDDGGETWETTPVRDARRLRAPGNEVNLPADVVVYTSGTADVVYASWTTTYPSALPRRPPVPTLARSDDAGLTFSAPMDITGSFFDDPANLGDDVPAPLRRREHFGGAVPYLALDGRGGLAATWVRRTANLAPGRGQPRYLSRSDDGGRSFAVSEMAPPSHLQDTGSVLAWSAGGGVRGTLHAVYEGKLGALQGDRDVHYRRSTDGGRTWSEAAVLNDDDPAQLFTQVLPSIATAPGGRLDVVWWDTRRGADRYATDVYYTHSVDAGRTWSANVALHDAPVSRRSGSWVDHFGDARQAPALASSDATAAVVWDDTRLATPASPVQDLYGAAVQFRPVRKSRGASASSYGAAAVAGAVAGAGVVITARRRRRP